VEMIAEWQHDHYEVYAIALPDERIVSMCPECDMGHTAHAWWRIKNMFILTSIIMFMFMLVLRDLFRDGQLLNYWMDYQGPIFLMLTCALTISGLIGFCAYKACALTRCKLAEEIFNLLGVKNGASVNLNKVTKEREQYLRGKAKWHEPGDKSKPACPSGKFIYSGVNWFFY